MQALEHLHRLLLEHPGGLGEYALICLLRREHPDLLPSGSLHDHRILYRTHFLLFHALYRLRDRLFRERSGHLDIGPLAIRLRPWVEGPRALDERDGLRDYYLNLANLELSGQEVQELLAGFWRLFLAQDRRREALETLGLARDAEEGCIRRRYRELARKHHPDRGGDNETLAAINAAMAILRACSGR